MYLAGTLGSPKQLEKGFLILAPWVTLDGQFFAVRSCPVCSRVLSSIPGLHSVDASCIPLPLPLVMTVKPVSGHWQMSPGWEGGSGIAPS